MRTLSIRLSILSVVLAAAALPALASHPTEVDSRPRAPVSELSRAAVHAGAHEATSSPSPSGYIGSNLQPAVQVGANARTDVTTDLANWVRSGLANFEYGQVGDATSPAYRQALQKYTDLRNASDHAALAKAAGSSSTLNR